MSKPTGQPLELFKPEALPLTPPDEDLAGSMKERFGPTPSSVSEEAGPVSSADDDPFEMPALAPGEANARKLEQSRRLALLAVFWSEARGFWGDRGDRLAWWLPLLLLLIVLLNLGAQYGINLWNRVIFDALEQRDAATVFFLSAVFLPLAATSVLLGVGAVYARMTTQRRWRAWVTNHVVNRWLAHGRYYQLNLVSGDHEIPEYRIGEDLRIATDAPIDFVTGVVAAVLSAATFIVVLWNIGGALTLDIAGLDVTIPGFLVLAAVVYAVIASGSMTIIGRRFVKVSEDRNQAEAEYRYALSRVRENGESIALLGGEGEERAGLDRNFRAVLFRWRELCGQYMRTTIVSQSSGLVAGVVPIILSAPKYLDGSMTLGQVMQAASAFAIVQVAFSWLVDNYPRLADWSASARRLASLMVALNTLDLAERGGGQERIERRFTQDSALRLINLSVTLDDGTAMVDDTDVRIMAGERVLVAGESGTGKSTLVRAIAGLWPWGGGTIEIKEGALLFLLPQRPYVPFGTLWRAAAYPAPAERWTKEDVTAALKATGLGHFASRLEEDAPWDQTLSGGEKQRLAFARLLLHRPDIIVLDEATSALDPNSQDTLMALLCKELQDATIVSVGHRPELEAFHSRKIVLERRRGGAKLVSDTALLSASVAQPSPKTFA